MEDEIKMLPVKQKQIVDKLKIAGYNYKDFSFNAIDNESFILTYKPNEFYNITIKDKRHRIRPALGGEIETTGESANWKTTMLRLEYWLNALKENIDVGNPWEEIENAKEQMHEMNYESYEEIFDKEDQNKIELKLDLLLDKINSLNIDTTIIKEDIAHLNKMSAKVSKKDWVLLLIGTVSSWVFSNVLSPEQTQTIWEAVKGLFSGLKNKLIS